MASMRRDEWSHPSVKHQPSVHMTAEEAQSFLQRGCLCACIAIQVEVEGGGAHQLEDGLAR